MRGGFVALKLEPCFLLLANFAAVLYMRIRPPCKGNEDVNGNRFENDTCSFKVEKRLQVPHGFAATFDIFLEIDPESENEIDDHGRAHGNEGSIDEVQPDL
jgi:hypothetical protein